ncbi:MAG: hypothetical protein Q8M94_12150, partial [Ignavibacteria bacterium]|nr:hypothetical protein [Ignavibacteria bacterium]
MKLDDELLKMFTNTFWGYGSFNHLFWFIGMEEGGGNNFQEIERRLTAWNKCQSNLVDLVHFHQEVFAGNDKELGFFSSPMKRLQKTWKGLIRVFLFSRGASSISVDQIKQFQFANLGRMNGSYQNGVTLIELFPLPSPGIQEWKYKNWTTLPFLKNRGLYKKDMKDKRISLLNEFIVTHSPEKVVFYGFVYKKFWEKIAGPFIEKVENCDAYFAKRGK